MRSTSRNAVVWRIVTGRSLLVLVGLVAIGLIAVTYFVPLSQAQRVDNAERAFAAKSDKLLKQVRAAVVSDREALAQGRFHPGASEVDEISRIAPVSAFGTNEVSVVVTLATSDTSEIEAAGFALQSRVGDLATLQLNVDRLTQLASLASVQKISASALRHPLNDRARQAIGVDNLLNQRVVSQTGRGVVVGIIDTGIDFRHLDFTAPGSAGRQTRIKALLDMTEYASQSPDPNWNYSLPGQSASIGHLYTEADLNSALQVAKPADQNSDSIKQRDKSGHGTHVAATAAGNGLAAPTPGTYAGMAPEADLIIVKASRQNDGSDSFRTTDVINAIEFVRQKAGELGEPFVINLSLGSQAGPHDGTNPDERAIDSLINGGSGRAVCIAAGNEGDANIHAQGTVPAGSSQSLGFNITGPAEFIDLYYRNSDRFSITLTRPDGTKLGPVSYDPNGFGSPDGQASDQYVKIYNSNDDKGDADPANDQPDIFIVFKSGAPTGAWQLTLQDADSNANQTYDAWTGDGLTFSSFVDNTSHLIASPGNARAAITVGAFITRAAGLPLGWWAPFTSPGPTADGRQKPEVGAPGYYLYSARSADVSDPNFGIIGFGGDAPTDNVHYTGLAGTSMAATVTAGAVALFLQSNPSLTSDQIKDSIKATAIHDQQTGPADWTPQFGAGKLNIAAAIQLNGRPVFTITGHFSGLGAEATAAVDLSGTTTQIGAVDSSGNFRFRNLVAGGTYTVTPRILSIYTYTLTPPSYTFANLSANQTANFTATKSTYNISGHVLGPTGKGVAGINVRPNFGSNNIVTTDANGFYLLADQPANQFYDVLVSNPSYTFTPTDRSILKLTKDETAIDFVARRLYALNGQVLDDAGKPVSGAFVTALGPFSPSGQTTDGNGNYRFASVVEAGTYTVTITAPGFAFDPNTVVTDINGDQTVNFVGHRVTSMVSVYGFIRDGGGNNLENVLVTLSGSVKGTLATNANGLFRFSNLPAGGSYTITPTLAGRAFTPVSRTVNNVTADASGQDFTGVTNPIDVTTNFVTQQYRDFLSREPDQSGLGFWSNQITQCGSSNCVEAARVNVSAAFFLSIEFQQTGYLVERMYKVAYRDATANSTLGGAHQLAVPTVRFNEFLQDTQRIGRGLVVLQPGWEQLLETNKQAYALEFVQTSRFLTALPTTMTPTEFVDRLNQNAGNVLSPIERTTAINLFGNASDTADMSARAQAVRQVAEDADLVRTESNRAFVLAEYFGYLRRNPNDAPDTDYTGYDFWLTKLNQFNGDYIAAEMVKAFISSDEYRKRFGQ